MSNFRDFKAKNKFKGSVNNSELVNFGASDIGKNSLDIVLKHAQKSGTLNLANRKLNAIPMEVYYINATPSKNKEPLSFDENSSGWWENVFLTKLVLVANTINVLDNDIALLNKLTYLDLSDNKIETLPNKITELIELKYLNISKNQLIALPHDLNKFKLLQQLICGHNKIKKIPDLSTMKDLEWLEFSNNNISEIPSSIVYLTALRRLDFSCNQIESMSFPLENHLGLRFIDLGHNKLNCFPSAISPNVEQLYLHVNRLITFPIRNLQKGLKELSVAHNQIKYLSENDLDNMPNLTTLSIANNKIGELPEKISNLTMLVNLDISNNELRNLPFSLGVMDNLKNISIEGNPFRAMKRTVIGAGTEIIKEYLRVRNTELDNNLPCTTNHSFAGLGNVSIEKGSAHLDQADLRTTGVVRLSSLGFTSVPDEMFTTLQSFKIKEIMLNKNKLTTFPLRIFEFEETLVDVDISNNQLSDIPSSIDTLRHIRRLNFSNNQITIIPSSLTKLNALVYMALSYNPLGKDIPDVVYGCRHLQTLHLSHCGLQSIDAIKIKTLTELEMLDVSNNDIGAVPAELGLCVNIKSLNLDGNSFKVPRLTLLAKGTMAVMEYLRSRIVPDK